MRGCRNIAACVQVLKLSIRVHSRHHPTGFVDNTYIYKSDPKAACDMIKIAHIPNSNPWYDHYKSVVSLRWKERMKTKPAAPTYLTQWNRNLF